MHTMRPTRRTMIRWCGAAGASSYILGPAVAMSQRGAAVQSPVDHLLLGVADLAKGMAWFEGKTGVRAAIGGSHPGRGTRNALASLGGQQYLEIIAPDPAQKTFGFRVDLRTLAEPRLITWAAATRDIDAVARRVGQTGLTVYGPIDGSRVRPDGKTLRWKTFGVMSPFVAGALDPVPFLIEWAADAVHPSQDSPAGCRLQAFEMDHPKPPRLVSLLKQLELDVPVKQSAAVALRATLATPKGEVVLT
jgi:Glyoxalase-like domain